MGNAIPLVNAVLGTLLLAFGRRLYWLFVAAVGFLVGLDLAATLLIEQPVWLQWSAALLAGGVGALVSLVAQRVAFAICGFCGGGYLGLVVARAAGLATGQLLLAVVLGLIGFVVAGAYMDLAIIILSSIVGAAVVVASMPLEPLAAAAAFVALAIIGIAFQTRRWKNVPTARDVPAS